MPCSKTRAFKLRLTKRRVCRNDTGKPAMFFVNRIACLFISDNRY